MLCDWWVPGVDYSIYEKIVANVTVVHYFSNKFSLMATSSDYSLVFGQINCVTVGGQFLHLDQVFSTSYPINLEITFKKEDLFKYILIVEIWLVVSFI